MLSLAHLRTWAQLTLVLLCLFTILAARASPIDGADNTVEQASDEDETFVDIVQDLTISLRGSDCFPALGFKMPKEPPSSLNGWWCSMSSEYAFVGFSYEVSECQSFSELRRDFTDIRQRFRGRYVRIYGACDRRGFYDDVINAAWQAGIGIHALIWFGFDGGNKWEARRDVLISTLHSNRFAKFVVRAVQFGSEPLFDEVLSAGELAKQVWEAKQRLSGLEIPVTVSDLAYSFQKNGGARSVISAMDIIDAHMLPFFAQDASTARNAWPLVQRDLNWFVQNGQGKKIHLSENGWPSKTYPGVQPNSKKAVANIQNERDYYNLLDAHCQYLKTVPGGGVGWFAHLYSDNQEPGYGIYDTSGNLKFPFNPHDSMRPEVSETFVHRHSLSVPMVRSTAKPRVQKDMNIPNDSQITLVNPQFEREPALVLVLSRDNIKNTVMRMKGDNEVLYKVESDASMARTSISRPDSDVPIAVLELKGLFSRDKITFQGEETRNVSDWLSGYGALRTFPFSFKYNEKRYSWKANYMNQLGLYNDENAVIAWFEGYKLRYIDGALRGFKAFLAMEAEAITLVGPEFDREPLLVLMLHRDGTRATTLRRRGGSNELLYNIVSETSSTRTSIYNSLSNDPMAVVEFKGIWGRDKITFHGQRKKKLNEWLLGYGPWQTFPISFHHNGRRYTWKTNFMNQLGLYSDRDNTNPVAWFERYKLRVVDGALRKFSAFLAMEEEAVEMQDLVVISFSIAKKVAHSSVI
ncbi:hypothetical protein NP233_g9320 [Leucocoprinus birnbaumii]|uniref:glucan endo-1,3-beta-D-glucosidase n=1 Tax=Leucocoprinus birnbaumii TaxID=56174 RepID=A0AAD5YNA7_9AGAR|nr:hypothetical protein NP233_g9320 [Leucocoprinus birnbaumii]